MRLAPLRDFGSNPGNLAGHLYVPPEREPGAALVVVLHGCTQTAARYDHGSGWSALAEANGFVVLFPEQQRTNNANLCFNWFVPDHISRGGGEAESIRQMIAHTVADHGIDPDRVFITGLSAGGAMTAVMLAAYPEVFGGGAIIAGLPYAAATTLPDALDQMRNPSVDAGKLIASVRAAAPAPARWPTVSIWHGSLDRTVSPRNAAALLDQWLGIHGVDPAAGRDEPIGTHRRRTWDDAAGRTVVESYSVPGMGHGTPLDTHGGCGATGPFMLDVGLSSTERLAAAWGLGTRAARATAPTPIAAPAARPFAMPSPAAMPSPHYRRPENVGESSRSGVQEVIERALRSAGLMK